MHGLMRNIITEKIGWRKGPWAPEEDKLLSGYVSLHGQGRWSSVAKCAGLNRSGKSCRLRWVNYLRPGLKRGQITPEEEAIIVELHALWGNKWSTIARYLLGRMDNEIKNFWRTHFKNKDKSYHQKQLVLRKTRSRVLKEKLHNDKLQAHENNVKMTPRAGVKTDSETKTTSIGIDHHHLQTELDDDMRGLANPILENGSTSLFPWSDVVADGEYGSWEGILWSLDDIAQI